MRSWLGFLAFSVGCGNPFPDVETPTVPLDDTSPDDTGPLVTPVDTAPTGDTGDGIVKTTPEPEPGDVTFRITLDRIELLTQECDQGTNGPAAEVYYELRVGNQFGWQQVLVLPPSDNVDMYPVGHENFAPLPIKAPPVDIRINEDGSDQLIIFGQIWDRDLGGNDLIGNYTDLIWTRPNDVVLGTTAFTRDGPSENDVADRCEVSLFITIERIDEKK